MTLLIGREGPRRDAFRFTDDVAALSLGPGPVLVPLTVIDEALKAGRDEPVGLSVDNDAGIEAIRPYLAAVALIAVAFPSFSDGRGLTLARRLRREGFAGTLRARGALIADQFAEALACGFDEIEVPDDTAGRQPPEQWMRAREIVTTLYQTGYGEGRSILQQRASARKDAAE